MLALSARAAPPAAPTGLSVVTLGVNAFRLTWTDNSTDESFFGVQIRFQGQDDTQWISLDQATNAGTGPVTMHQIINVENTATTYQFRVLAVKSGPPQEISATATVTAPATPATITFGNPSGLIASSTDGVITLSWADNANSEWGYRVENRVGTSGNFVELGSTNPNQALNLAINGHLPNTTYQYRVRGYKYSTPQFTQYSNTVTIGTKPFAAPTNLVATRENERDIGLSQIDNSAAESGYVIEYRVAGTTDWSVLGSTGPNVSTVTPIPDLFDPATSYELRTRAFIGTAEAPDAYSAYSNVAAVDTLFTAPTGASATPVSNREVQVAWLDGSAVEQGYAVYFRQSGAPEFSLHGYAAANATSHVVNGLKAALPYEFQVKAAYAANAPTNRNTIVFSAASATVTSTTRDEMTSAVYTEGVVGRSFSHELVTTSVSALASASVTNLPAGLGFDLSTRRITGTPADIGVTECPVTLTFADGWTHETTLTIRILSPPVAAPLPAPLVLRTGVPHSLPLSTAFSDPDSESAVSVQTNLGAMRVLLFNLATPLTVSNFMAYAESGDYAGTAFHRSVPGFVVQGGAFRPEPASGPAVFTSVATRPPVPNEPGLSSVRGTVAMAKLGGDPDSATNQFFVNLANNGPILNNQNGGFTVFGRVVLADMAVADAMAALPTADYTITLNGAPAEFEDWPLTAASPAMNNSLAVVISAVQAVPVLSFSVVTNTNPSVVSASVSTGNLDFTPLSPGTAVLTVRATDLDGNSSDLEYTVQVDQTFAHWADTQGLPEGQRGPLDDPDGDGLNNFAEFAHLGIPGTVDAADIRPVLRLNDPEVAQTPNLTVAFSLRKNAHLDYTASFNTNLVSGAWTPLWNSRVNGTGGPGVVSVVDQATHIRIKLKDTDFSPLDRSRFLAIEVGEP